MLGPYEISGRLPWWLNRIAQGGEVLAPGPRDLALQYIDARDLAGWMVACAEQTTVGVYNSISASGHTNMLEVLETYRVMTNSDAKFTWVPPDFILEQGIKAWSEMPIWVDPAPRGIHSFDASKAARAGLTCRPIAETVTDTWAWMQSGGLPQMSVGLSTLGVSTEKKRATLAAWAHQIR